MTIRHRPGRVHSNSDALSRRPCDRVGDPKCRQCKRPSSGRVEQSIRDSDAHDGEGNLSSLPGGEQDPPATSALPSEAYPPAGSNLPRDLYPPDEQNPPYELAPPCSVYSPGVMTNESRVEDSPARVQTLEATAGHGEADTVISSVDIRREQLSDDYLSPVIELSRDNI